MVNVFRSMRIVDRSVAVKVRSHSSRGRKYGRLFSCSHTASSSPRRWLPRCHRLERQARPRCAPCRSQLDRPSPPLVQFSPAPRHVAGRTNAWTCCKVTQPRSSRLQRVSPIARRTTRSVSRPGSATTRPGNTSRYVSAATCHAALLLHSCAHALIVPCLCRCGWRRQNRRLRWRRPGSTAGKSRIRISSTPRVWDDPPF